MSLLPLLVVLDVDGVTRRGVTDVADPKVMALFSKITANEAFRRTGSHFAFLSGSQVLSRPDLKDWCGCNVGLLDVFRGHIEPQQIAAGWCSVTGQLGADRLVVADGDGAFDGQLSDCFPLRTAAVGVQLLVEGFLDDCASVGRNGESIAQAQQLLRSATHDEELWTRLGSPMLHQTPPFLEPLALYIRETLDPHFRLVCNGATIEVHSTVTEMPEPAVDCVSVAQLSERLAEGVRCTKALADEVAEVSVGIAHRGHDIQFRYSVLLRTTKGATVKSMKAARPSHTVVTVGDGNVDFSMHRIADVSFHVGPRSVWETQRQWAAVDHVALVTCGTDAERDSQLTEGTAAVLEAILTALQIEGEAATTKSVIDNLGAKVVLVK